MAIQITYQKKLEHHLSMYREWRLGVREKGTFDYRGTTRSYGHILPTSLRRLNLLEPFRGEICDYLDSHKDIRPHRYFHHLNSSQAFGFNLFYPYMTTAPRDLSKSMGVGPIRHWAFESIPVRGEETNVDVVLNGPRSPIYIEVKLSESGFGTATPDARHRDKLNRYYRPVLEKVVDPRLLEPDAFFGAYQILRNLWLAARHPKGSAVFLFPRENRGLDEALTPVLRLVGPGLRSRVRVLHVEDVLRKLAARDSPLAWYAKLLQEKYIPEAAAE